MKVCDPIGKRYIVSRMWSRVFWCCCGYVPILLVYCFDREFRGTSRFVLAAGPALIFYLVVMGYMVDTCKIDHSTNVWKMARWAALSVSPFFVLLAVALVKLLNQ